MNALVHWACLKRRFPTWLLASTVSGQAGSKCMHTKHSRRAPLCVCVSSCAAARLTYSFVGAWERLQLCTAVMTAVRMVALSTAVAYIADICTGCYGVRLPYNINN